MVPTVIRVMKKWIPLESMIEVELVVAHILKARTSEVNDTHDGRDGVQTRVQCLDARENGTLCSVV